MWIGDQFFSGVFVAGKLRWGRQKSAVATERRYALAFSPFNEEEAKNAKVSG